MAVLRYWLVLAAGIALAAYFLPGIDFGGNWGVLALVVLLLSIFNLILKPLLILFTLPFVILSLGLGIWVINALLLYWAGRIVDGFHIESFWYALGGSAIISLTNMLYSMLTKDKKGRPKGGAKRIRGGRRDDNVIDV